MTPRPMPTPRPARCDPRVGFLLSIKFSTTPGARGRWPSPRSRGHPRVCKKSLPDVLEPSVSVYTAVGDELDVLGAVETSDGQIARPCHVTT
jgi:hypothetical protein